MAVLVDKPIQHSKQYIHWLKICHLYWNDWL